MRQGYEVTKNGTEICYHCGNELEYATFQSETFNWRGGTMVFSCTSCGNEIKRDFVPINYLKDEEQIRALFIMAGLGKDLADIAFTKYKEIQNLKKFVIEGKEELSNELEKLRK